MQNKFARNSPNPPLRPSAARERDLRVATAGRHSIYFVSAPALKNDKWTFKKLWFSPWPSPFFLSVLSPPHVLFPFGFVAVYFPNNGGRRANARRSLCRGSVIIFFFCAFYLILFSLYFFFLLEITINTPRNIHEYLCFAGLQYQRHQQWPSVKWTTRNLSNGFHCCTTR